MRADKQPATQQVQGQDDAGAPPQYEATAGGSGGGRGGDTSRWRRRRSEPPQDPEEDNTYDERQDWHWDTSITNVGTINVDVDAALPKVPAPATESVPTEVDEWGIDVLESDNCPPLNIVIFIVGSRGDVQPYLALALELVKTRGHRVRIATHATFADMVTEATVQLAGLTDARGRPLTSLLEHFDIGGDPQQLMAYMVKNPGLLPGVSSLANGDIGRKRKMVKQMLFGCYLACFSPHQKTRRPFGADAIISNPPAFAHIHLAEALGIPLLMSFTMPWTPTTAFPHPFVMAKSHSTDNAWENYTSFVLADALMWQGLGDLINAFRYNILGLRPLNLARGPLVIQRLQIPTTYAWSEHLLPKPRDWKTNTDVVGFYSLLSDTRRFKPDSELAQFLAAGPPPVYIGFGSVVVDKPDELTAIILESVRRAGIRALVSAGWADIGGGTVDPKSVFIIKGNIPHDWLFADDRVSAVCHHGGAGTTAAGLREGRPTIIVPFFGDQWFWGTAVAEAGAGPAPIPYAELSVDKLSEAFKFALSPAVREAAQDIGAKIRAENGVHRGVESFHKHLPLLNMRCELDPSRIAIWWSEPHCMRLSGAAAAVLVDAHILSWSQLKPHRAIDYNATRHYTDPFMSVGQSVLTLGGLAVQGTGELFYAPIRGFTDLIWGLPKASFDVIRELQEGFENVPSIMGSPQRSRRKVDSFSSGMGAAGKGFAFGLYDGLTGLVTEPYNGAKRRGAQGMLEGAVASWVSLPARLVSGSLGLVVHPAAGMFRGARARLSRTGILANDWVLYSPRQSESHEAAESLTKAEREAIVSAWKDLSHPDYIKTRQRVDKNRRREAEAKLLCPDPEMNGSQRLIKGTAALYSRWQRGRSASVSGTASTGGQRAPSDDMAQTTKTTTTASAAGVAGEPAPGLPRHFSAPDALAGTTDKDPRWAETHSRLASGDMKGAPPEYGSDVGSTSVRSSAKEMPQLKADTLQGFTARPRATRNESSQTSSLHPESFMRPHTQASFSSYASTADVAMAGTDRWYAQSGAGSTVSSPTDGAGDDVGAWRTYSGAAPLSDGHSTWTGHEAWNSPESFRSPASVATDSTPAWSSGGDTPRGSSAWRSPDLRSPASVATDTTLAWSGAGAGAAKGSTPRDALWSPPPSAATDSTPAWTSGTYDSPRDTPVVTPATSSAPTHDLPSTASSDTFTTASTTRRASADEPDVKNGDWKRRSLSMLGMGKNKNKNKNKVK